MQKIRKAMLIGLGFILIFSSISNFSPVTAQQNNNSGVNTNLVSTVAVFNDTWAWGFNSLEQSLNTYAISFDYYPSSSIGVVDISGYAKVILEADQPQAFNDAVVANRGYFENYVMNGGILEIHAATNSLWTGILPGGFNYTAQGRDLVNITAPTHPILNSPHIISDSELDYWSSSVHGYLSGLHPGDSILMTAQYDQYSQANPAVVESRLGKGDIIISTQTLEYAAGNAKSYILDNFVTYFPVLSTKVAIFSDSPAWGYTSLTDVLNKFAIPYDVWGSSNFGLVDLSQYVKVIIESNQPAPFNQELQGNNSYFDNYVMNGGTLEFHSATNDQWTGPLPGGFLYTPDFPDNIQILDPSHPVLHVPNYITDSQLDNWSSSAHGLLSGLQPKDKVILKGDNTINAGGVGPVLIERDNGYGRIIITSQTVEWGYAHGYSKLLENLVLYDYPRGNVPLSPIINSAPDNQIISQGGSFIATWNIRDPSPNNYQIMIDGSVVSSGIWLSNSDINYDLSYLGIGVYNITIQAFSGSGLSTSYSFMFEVRDTINPTMVFATPSLSYELNTFGNIMYITAYDLSGGGNYDYSIDGITQNSGYWYNGTQFSVNVDGLSLGDHTFSITVYDYYGNSVTSTATISVYQITTTTTTTPPPPPPTTTTSRIPPTTTSSSQNSKPDTQSTSTPSLPLPFASNLLIIMSLASVAILVRRSKNKVN